MTTTDVRPACTSPDPRGLSDGKQDGRSAARIGAALAAPLRGRQRREPGGRRHAHLVRLNDAEAAAVRERADRLGLSVPRLLVECATRGDAATLPERRGLAVELLALRRQVAGIAGNVNQLAARANSGGTVTEAEEVATLDRAGRVLDRLAEALDRLR